MNYIVLDLEFNQPFAFRGGIKAVADPICPFEIIQIGAVKLNDAFEVTEQFSCYVKPQIYKRIHPYVEKITGITKQTVEDGLSFPTAYGDFLNFIGNRSEAVLCTWGGDDIRSLLRNVAYHNLNADLLPNQCLNVQVYASEYLNQEAGKCIGLKNAVELLGIEIEDAFHDALYDAAYTGKILQMVHPEQIKANKYNAAELLIPKPKKARINTRALLNHFSGIFGGDLSEEECRMIKQAYKMGRNNTFDVPSTKRSAGPE